ncbi:hypothetical protein CMI47_20090 [Candidatus Pacearchaeota archaeon]|nr:hypothetical protein [Candidatus Pacearchaeota archaeon]|tara:strand:+ start:1128 stop:1322 length:195 start_codon:yes stop_codon:yes gene_type:complete
MLTVPNALSVDVAYVRIPNPEDLVDLFVDTATEEEWKDGDDIDFAVLAEAVVRHLTKKYNIAVH